MMPGSRDPAQISSDAAALVLTGVLAAALAIKAVSWREIPRPPPRRSEASIEVSLQPEAAVTPPAASVAPAPAVPLRAAARKTATRRATQWQSKTAEVPMTAAAEPMAADQDAVPDGSASVAPASADSHPDLDAQYAAGLRADIDHRTRPPDSAQYRLHRPSGEVRVGFVVTRGGEAKAVAVLRSSGSSILDEAACAIVSSGHYPPMPAKVFAGEAEHGFAVTIEFRPAIAAIAANRAILNEI